MGYGPTPSAVVAIVEHVGLPVTPDVASVSPPTNPV